MNVWSVECGGGIHPSTPPLNSIYIVYSCIQIEIVFSGGAPFPLHSTFIKLKQYISLMYIYAYYIYIYMKHNIMDIMRVWSGVEWGPYHSYTLII